MISSFNPIYKKNQIEFDLDIHITELANMLTCDICRIFMFDDDKHYATIKISYVKDNRSLDKDKGSFYFKNSSDSDSLFNLMIESNEIIIYRKGEKIYKDKQYIPYIDSINEEIYIPIFSQAKTHYEAIGCLYLGNFDHNIDYEMLNQNGIKDMIYIIANEFNAMYEKYRQKATLLNILHIFSKIFTDLEPFVINHAFNVAFFCSCIAEKINLTSDEKYELYLASILHDIGKIYIKLDIINKSGKLTNEEYDAVKMHAIYGYDIVTELVNGINYLSRLPDIVRHHHERYDGSGYPDGLKGEEIPLMSRIMAIADAADAMLSERSYKKIKPLDEVIADITANKGSQFDPRIADIFLIVLKDNLRPVNDAILEPISLCTLLIDTKEKEYTFQGNLIKRELGFELQIDIKDEVKYLKKDKIIKSTLVIEKGNKLFAYKPKILEIKRNHIFISEITTIPNNKYFSPLWELPGKIHINKNNDLDININVIGRDLIEFFANKNETYQLYINKVYLMDFKFEDDSVMEIQGEIVRTYEIGYKNYYEFKFLNIDESRRDIIFKQIFKKQTGLIRKLSSNFF